MISSIVKNNVLTAYRSENMTIPQLSNRYGISQKQIEKIIFPNGKGSVSLGFSRVISVKKQDKVLIPVDVKSMDKKEIQRQAGIKAAITRRKNLEAKKEPIQLTDSQRLDRLELMVTRLENTVEKLIKLIENGTVKI